MNNIERFARAYCEALGLDPDQEFRFGKQNEIVCRLWEEYAPMARKELHDRAVAAAHAALDAHQSK